MRSAEQQAAREQGSTAGTCRAQVPWHPGHAKKDGAQKDLGEVTTYTFCPGKCRQECVYVSGWLSAHYIILVLIVAFKGILGHAGIFSY